MKLFSLVIGLSIFAGAACAEEYTGPLGLLPTEVVRQVLEQDPAVSAARAGLDVGRYEADILARSPYEWTPTVLGQRRAVQGGSNLNEWNVGVERTFRLPNKAAADQRIGRGMVEVSEIRYTEALRQASLTLMALWVDWLAAERSLGLAEKNLQSVQDSLAAVEKRALAGDASELDVSLARAELADQRRLHNDAKTLAAAAWVHLSTRFPGIDRQIVQLPKPVPLDRDMTFWRERILAESNALKVMQAQLQVAQGQAERARADKIPDPSLSFFTASEQGGRERINGMSVSVPIPGGARSSRSAKAQAELEVLSQEVMLAKRQLEADIASAVAIAQGTYDSFRIANEGAEAMQRNASLMQRAYALGEAELQALLQARRQATSAMTNVVQTQVTALKSYYGLLVNAHLVWDFD